MPNAIPLFQADSSALVASLAVRLRFAQERFQAKQSWTPAEFEASKAELDSISADADRLAKSENILAAGREQLLGYHDSLDGSDQPYSLWIPDGYDGSRALPLAVLLHGQGMFNPLQCRAHPIGNMIVVAPQGRGGMDYMYVGEADVLNVLDHVQSLLRVDTDRVYICGASMGGTGAWHLATRFPDRFAGIMPLCGNTDINVWAELWHWRTPANSPLAEVRHFLREDTSSFTYALNLQHVSVVALQGEADTIVNQLHARRMNDALKNSGHAAHQIHILPYMTHGISANYELGLRSLARNPKPTRVRYKTAWLRYPGAYWLHITGLQRRLRHATVDGKAAPALKTISVETSNVSALSIDPARLPFSELPVQIEIDRTVFHPPFVTQTGRGFCFQRASDGSWTAETLREKPQPFPPRKSARVEGPVEHAFLSRFVIVAGDAPSQPDELHQASAAAATEFGRQWQTRFCVPCRRKTAHELSAADIADSNLVLFGTAETNAFIRKVIGKLPLSIIGETIRLGDTTYTGPNAGAMLCYPNPLNPERYVVLISGATPRSYADINVRFGNWFDWVPYDFRKHFDFAVFDDLTSGRHPETFLTWGFFDEQWRLTPELTFPAVESFRRVLVPRVFPTIHLKELANEKSRPDTVYLDEAIADNTNMTKEYLERNRTLDGSPLQLLGRNYTRGLCCRFPCALTFSCSGYGRLKVTAGVGWDGATEPCDDRKQFEKVHVAIVADGKPVFEAHHQMYNSLPLEIDVDLAGAQSVTLSANGGLPWLNGSFVWADARLEGRRENPPKPATRAKRKTAKTKKLSPKKKKSKPRRK
jgi:dienelactone hydrolase